MKLYTTVVGLITLGLALFTNPAYASDIKYLDDPRVQGARVYLTDEPCLRELGHNYHRAYGVLMRADGKKKVIEGCYKEGVVALEPDQPANEPVYVISFVNGYVMMSSQSHFKVVW